MSDLFEGAKDITIFDEVGGVFSTNAEIDNERHKIGISLTFQNITPEQIEKKRIQLRDLLKAELREREKQSYMKFLQKVRKDIRWTEVDGELYPSVTSVLNTINPVDFFMDSEKLKAYSARGNVLDVILQKYVETGKWFNPKDLPETWQDLKQMKLFKLEMTGNLPGWVEKYKPEFKEGHKKVISKKYKYAGSPDIAFGLLNDIPTLFDLKNRTSMSRQEQVKTMKQMSAYARADNIGHEIKQLCIIIINDSTKQGFSAPVTTTEIDKYFDLFLADLFEFQEMFNLN